MKFHSAHQFKMTGLHLVFWSVYALSEYLANAMHLQTAQYYSLLRSTLLSLPALIIATYFMVGYAVPHYLKSDKWFRFLICIVLVGAFLFYARIKWLELMGYLENNRHYRIPPTKVVKNVVRDYAIVALAVCLHIIADYRQQQKQNEALIKAKAEAEIKLLKGQLHPHFLFNSLNNIYSLALMKSDRTADSILMLTELLDYLVYRANMDMVPLQKELQLLENYIGLEKLRHGDKLKIKMGIDIEDEELKLSPLLLLPFAENCFKHGGVGPDGYFRIDIRLSVTRNNLYFYLANSQKVHQQEEPLPGGLGLQNIRQRLQLIYPDRHELTIENTTQTYRTQLSINLE